MSRGCAGLLLLVALLAPRSGAHAEEVHPAIRRSSEVATRNWVNLRIGAALAFPFPKTAMCLELSPWEFLAVEGCGNGSGFLEHEDSTEVAHFRAKLLLAARKLAGSWFELKMNAGFAELQTGADSPGFHFTGVGPGLGETAGPELGASVRGLVPLSSSGLELVGELSLDLAWLPYAGGLSPPAQTFQPSASASVGIGF